MQAMPTREVEQRFLDDYSRLTPEERRRFLIALRAFIADLQTGHFRAGLRIHRLENHPGIWSMTWAPDGRATFEYGIEQNAGEPHIIWRRVGTHAVYGNP